MNNSLIERNRRACATLIDTSDEAQAAFAARQEKLIAVPNFPVDRWYNDEDFCSAYNTAVFWKKERDKLQARVTQLTGHLDWVKWSEEGVVEAKARIASLEQENKRLMAICMGLPLNHEPC